MSLYQKIPFQKAGNKNNLMNSVSEEAQSIATKPSKAVLQENKLLTRRLSLADSFSLTIALSAFLNHFYNLREPVVLIVFLTFLIAGGFYLFDQYKNNLLCYFILFGFLILIAASGYFFKIDYRMLIKKVYHWCLIYNGDKSLYDRWSGFAVTACILFVSEGILYPIHHYKKVKNILASLSAILLVIAALNKIYVPKVSVFIVLFYVIVAVTIFCSNHFYRNKKDNGRRIATLYLAPVCFLIAFCAILLPTGNEPIKWTGVKQVIVNIHEQGSIWMTQLEYFFDRTGSEFALNYSGYSEKEDSELGGEIRKDSTTALYVDAINKSTAKGYLIGSVRDIYTGRKWESSNSKITLSKEGYYYDFYELLKALAVEKMTGTDVSNFIKKRDYTIIYHDIRTRSIFYPLKTYNIVFHKKVNYAETPQGAFVFKRAKSYGMRYDVFYYEMNLDNEDFKKLLRGGVSSDVKISEDQLVKVAEEVFDDKTLGSGLNLKDLEKEIGQREQNIKKTYTILPDSLPNRVKELAYALTENDTNNYDKLKSIETYLNTLPYTTKIEKTPRGEDFVDYFLFKQQKGYCTYFASAMGVLARCVGIPTRYVEGYIVDDHNKSSSHSYEVLNSNAHSWVEAYLDGIGWIPFEPTSGFYEGRYKIWKETTTDSLNPDSGTTAAMPTGIPNNYADMLNKIAQENSLNEDKAPNYTHLALICTIILCIIILFFIILSVYYLILEKRYQRKFRYASDNEKLYLTVSEILRFLEMEGYKLSSNETLFSYAQRIGNKVIFQKNNFLEVANVFMKSRYGEKAVNTEELILVKQFCKDLKRNLTEKRGKRAMFFDRFLFLHFNQ